MTRLLAGLLFTLVVIGALIHDLGASLGVPAAMEWTVGRSFRGWLHFALTAPVTFPLVAIGLVLCGIGVSLHLLADQFDWTWERRWPTWALASLD